MTTNTHFFGSNLHAFAPLNDSCAFNHVVLKNISNYADFFTRIHLRIQVSLPPSLGTTNQTVALRKGKGRCLLVDKEFSKTPSVESFYLDYEIIVGEGVADCINHFWNLGKKVKPILMVKQGIGKAVMQISS